MALSETEHAKQNLFRQLAVAYFLCQSFASIMWRAMIFRDQNFRNLFLVHGANDWPLLSFAPSDGTLYIGAGAASALGIQKKRNWAWPALCIHAGAAGYAAIFCWTVTLTNHGQAQISW